MKASSLHTCTVINQQTLSHALRKTKTEIGGVERLLLAHLQSFLPQYLYLRSAADTSATCKKETGRERKRPHASERERERERERPCARERIKEREEDRERERRPASESAQEFHTDTDTDTQTHRHTDTQTHRHTDTQTNRHTDTQTQVSWWTWRFEHACDSGSR